MQFFNTKIPSSITFKNDTITVRQLKLCRKQTKSYAQIL